MPVSRITPKLSENGRRDPDNYLGVPGATEDEYETLLGVDKEASTVEQRNACRAKADEIVARRAAMVRKATIAALRTERSTDKDWLDTTEAALLANTSVSTVQRWCNLGFVVAEKVETTNEWRVDRASLKAWLDDPVSGHGFDVDGVKRG